MTEAEASFRAIPEARVDFAEIFSRIFVRALSTGRETPLQPRISASTTLNELTALANGAGLPLDQLLSQAALESYRVKRGPGKRAVRDSLAFLEADGRSEVDLRFTDQSSVAWSITSGQVLQTVQNANRAIELIDDVSLGNDIPIFKLLGLRNLSSFVGEIFASELCRMQKDRLLPNPNQDGYPDLLALTPEGRNYVDERERRGQTSVKEFWSPYPYGGIEVKATCGDTPTAKKRPKPKIGEVRLQILEKVNWKAHHRETNKLLGIYWDFVDGLPTVLAAFYRNDLSVEDWGNVVTPKDGGGRTTSVSTMKRSGVKRMGQGWLILPRTNDYRKPLCRQKIFSITDGQIGQMCTAWQ